jgi:hypothetical protein
LLVSRFLVSVVACTFVALACSARDPLEAELRSVHVADVHLDPETDSPVVDLVEDGADGRSLSIWVSEFEAESIERAIDHQLGPRPNPHDLVKSVLDKVEGRVRRTLVTELRDGTYFAVIELELHGGTISIDARPSDAIAVALRAGAPMLVRDSLFAERGFDPDGERALEIDWRPTTTSECPACAQP